MIVLGSQVFGQALMDSCAVGSFTKTETKKSIKNLNPKNGKNCKRKRKKGVLSFAILETRSLTRSLQLSRFRLPTKGTTHPQHINIIAHGPIQRKWKGFKLKYSTQVFILLLSLLWSHFPNPSRFNSTNRQNPQCIKMALTFEPMLTF